MKINLKHVKKCDQSWDEMMPCKDGRICQKCTKVIVDFRPLSDKEVVETHMFSKEPVCGIYREDQLKIENPVTSIRKYSKVKINAIWLGLLGLIYTSNIKATDKKIPTIQLDSEGEVSNSSQFSLIQDSIPIKEKFIVHGKLTLENNEALIGGTILVKNSMYGNISDVDGYYKLDITEALDTVNQITLVYTYTGYKAYERSFQKGDTLEINIKFDEFPVYKELVGTVFGVTSKQVEENKEPKKKSFSDRIKNIFNRKEKK